MIWGGKSTIFGNIHFQPTQLNGGPSQVLDRSVDVLSLSPTAGARFKPRWVGKFYPRVFFGGRKNWKSQKHHVFFKDLFFWLVSNSHRGLCYKNKVVRGFFFTPQKHILKQASLAQKEAQKINWWRINLRMKRTQQCIFRKWCGVWKWGFQSSEDWVKLGPDTIPPLWWSFRYHTLPGPSDDLVKLGFCLQRSFNSDLTWRYFI